MIPRHNATYSSFLSSSFYLTTYTYKLRLSNQTLTNQTPPGPVKTNRQNFIRSISSSQSSSSFASFAQFPIRPGPQHNHSSNRLSFVLSQLCFVLLFILPFGFFPSFQCNSKVFHRTWTTDKSLYVHIPLCTSFSIGDYGRRILTTNVLFIQCKNVLNTTKMKVTTNDVFVAITLYFFI